MENMEQYYKQIEDYLNNQMPQKKRADFEKEMEHNQELMQEVEAFRFEQDAKELLVYQHYLDKVKSWEWVEPDLEDPEKKTEVYAEEMEAASIHEQNLSPKNVIESKSYQAKEEVRVKERIFLKQRQLRALAAGLAILIAGWYLWSWMNTESSSNTEENLELQATTPIAMAEEIYSLEANTDERFSSLRVNRNKSIDPTTEISITDQTLAAYQDNDFKKVIDLLSPIDDNAITALQLYLLAHSYFESGAYDKAADEFRKLRGGAYTQRSEFYLMLSLLALNKQNTPEFTALRDEFIDEGPQNYRNIALEIKNKLNRPEGMYFNKSPIALNLILKIVLPFL